MKTIIQIIFIATLTYLSQFLFPWWSLFFTAAIFGALINTKSITTFIAGFAAIFVLWFLQVYFIDMANEAILSTKVAAVFSLTPIMLMLVTALIGGICGGFGALTGKLFADLFKKKKKTYSVYT